MVQFKPTVEKVIVSHRYVVKTLVAITVLWPLAAHVVLHMMCEKKCYTTPYPSICFPSKGLCMILTKTHVLIVDIRWY